MMGSSYVDVDDAYIDRLKDDIRIACHRLEEHGHESLVVTVKGSNHDLIGSEIGIHFLRDRSVFVNDFVLYSIASKHRVKQEATVVEVPVKKTIHVHSTKTFDVPNIPDSLNTPLPVVENGDDDENKLFDDDTDDYDDGGDDFSGILDTLGGGPENQDKMDTERVGISGSGAKVNKRKVEKKGEMKSSNYDLKRMQDVKVVLTKLEDDEVKNEKSTGETVARAVSKIVDRSAKAKKVRKIDGKSEEKAAADDNAEKINNSIENENAEVIDKDEIQVVQIPVKSKVQIKEIKAEQTPSGQYRCSHCYQFLSSKDHITQHIQDHTAFACTWCGKLCRSYESLEKHKKFRGCSRHLIDFECKPCGEKFGSELDLKAHVEKVHDNILKVMKGTFKCEKCNTIFDYQGHLSEHNQKIPDCDKVADKDNSEDNDKKTDRKQEVSYKNTDTGETKVTTVGKLLDKVKNLSRKCKVTCELCGKYYESKSSYQRHIRIHYELKMIPCNICGASFTNMDNYKKHIKIHKEKPFCCLTCYNRFSCKILLDNHMNLNCKPFPTKEELVCKDCGYQSSNRSSYKQHRRLLHTEMLETCDICNKSFKRRTHLQQHLRTVHGEVPQIARESKTIESIECKICNKKFLSNRILYSHMKTHGPPNIRCDKCDYKTTTRKNLVGHMRTHSDKSRIQPYVCEICGKAYGTKYYLITHSRIHTGERPYICDFPECGKGFRSADTLQTHKKRHSDTCGYMCDFCGRGFKTRSEFSHHRRYHIIEYRWPCEYCEEKFKMLKYYKNHILKKHPEKTEEVEKKRNCLFFRCTMCPKVFAKRNYWQEHENFHKGHKPWVCQYCDKSFCSKSNLRQHVRSHLGVNNKKCALCSRSYSDLEMLKRHLKEKHSLSEPVAAIRVEEVKLKAQTASTVRPVRTKALSVRPKGQGQEVVEKMEKNSLEDSREDSREEGVPFDQMMAIQMRNEDLESSLRLQQFHQQYVILDQGNRIPNLPPWQE